MYMPLLYQRDHRINNPKQNKPVLSRDELRSIWRGYCIFHLSSTLDYFEKKLRKAKDLAQLCSYALQVGHGAILTSAAPVRSLISLKISNIHDELILPFRLSPQFNIPKTSPLCV